MALCDICKKIMPGNNPSVTISLGKAVAPGWQISPYRLISRSQKLIKHAIMVHMEPSGGKSGQITDDAMKAWLKDREERYGHGDCLLCPECSALLTPPREVKEPKSKVREEIAAGSRMQEQFDENREKLRRQYAEERTAAVRSKFPSEGEALTHERQRALYLEEFMLQLFFLGTSSIRSEKTGEILSISAETARWAIPYCRQIASAREHFFKRNFKAASAEYEKIVKELPTAAIVLNDLGVCHGEMGNNELAYTYLQKALAYAPEEKRNEVLPNLLKLEREHMVCPEKSELKPTNGPTGGKETTEKRPWWRFWK